MTGNQFVQVSPDSTGKLIDNSEVALAVPVYLTQWVASTVYVAGAVVQPIIPNGYAYICTIGGTSYSSQPAFPTTSGATVAESGGPTWKCYSIVERQRVVVADPTNPAALQAIANSPPPTQTYGGTVFLAAEQLPYGALQDIQEKLRLLLAELRVTNMVLAAGLNVPDDLDAMRADPFIVDSGRT